MAWPPTILQPIISIRCYTHSLLYYVSAYLSAQCKWAVKNGNNNHKNKNNHDDDDANDNEEKTRIANRYTLLFSLFIFFTNVFTMRTQICFLSMIFRFNASNFLKKIGFWLVDLCICLSGSQTFGRLFWYSVDSFSVQKNFLKNELFLPLLLLVIRYHVLIHSSFSLPEICTLRYGHNRKLHFSNSSLMSKGVFLFNFRI